MNTTQPAIKSLKGVVVRAVLPKTRTLMIERLVKHPAYKKYIKRTTKIMFHDEDNVSQTGDEVQIQPCRPYSKRKSFKLLRVIKEAQR